MYRVILPLLLVFNLLFTGCDDLGELAEHWPNTDFTRRTVPLVDLEIIEAKDTFNAVNHPKKVALNRVKDVDEEDAVVSVALGGEVCAYPKRLSRGWVNDTLNGVPIFVLQCPLSNTTVVWERPVRRGKPLEFSPSGIIRGSEMLVYDDQTESFWQPSTGECIVGDYMGAQLDNIPCRVESLERFQTHNPGAKVAVLQRKVRRFFINGKKDEDAVWASRFFDRASEDYFGRLKPTTLYPLFANEDYDAEKEGLPQDALVVYVPSLEKAWDLELLKEQRSLQDHNVVITWRPGMVSTAFGMSGRGSIDIGNLVVQKRLENRELEDIVYNVSFMGAFREIYPDLEVEH
tara:strand:- start:44463 stop:45500 length:1038 start_codon:yes stop_codon:yes gene_type:complete